MIDYVAAPKSSSTSFSFHVRGAEASTFPFRVSAPNRTLNGADFALCLRFENPAPPSTSRDCGADISTWFRLGPIKVPVIRHGYDSKTLRPRLPPASTVLRCALLDFSCKPASPRRALPVFSCRLPCTSPDSLQGLNFVQGKRGSARQIVLRARFSACTSAVLLQTVVHFARFLARVRADAGIRGKCTASCKKSGEMHARPSSSWGSWRIFG